MSKDQQVTAVRVANVPTGDFEAATEGDDPATVTKLAEMGKKTGRAGFKEATHLIGAVRRFAEICSDNDPAIVASSSCGVGATGDGSAPSRRRLPKRKPLRSP